MLQENGNRPPFVGHEYKEIVADSRMAAMLVDCYENFGWSVDETGSWQNFYQNSNHYTTIRMKRDRKIMNKMELTRLQRHFEACLAELKSLEQSKTSSATAVAMIAGVLGTVFMAGSVFAVTHTPPVIWLCILLAIPGLIGWIVPYFLYQGIMKEQTRKVQPLIEDKYEEIYTICEKGHSLL